MRGLHLILPLLALSGACSMKKNLDEMHDKTTSMSQTTQEMKTTTTAMNDVTNGMGSFLKQGDSSKTRDEALDNMEKAEGLMEKLLYGTKYNYAWEFQLWQPNSEAAIDMLEIREELKAEAVIEFGKTLTRWVVPGKKWSLDATKQTPEREDLYAFVSPIHKINPYQRAICKGTSMTPIALSDIIYDGLLKSKALNEGRITRDDLSHADREVLREEQSLVFALQLRTRVLPIIALGRSSKIQEGWFDGMFSQLGMLMWKWTPTFATSSSTVTGVDVHQKNLEEIDYLVEILAEGIKTRKVLERLGAAVPLDKNVVKIWRNMNLEPIKTSLRKDGAKSQALLDGIARFEKAVSDTIVGAPQK